jgi:hypothetical protein
MILFRYPGYPPAVATPGHNRKPLQGLCLCGLVSPWIAGDLIGAGTAGFWSRCGRIPGLFSGKAFLWRPWELFFGWERSAARMEPRPPGGLFVGRWVWALCFARPVPCGSLFSEGVFVAPVGAFFRLGAQRGSGGTSPSRWPVCWTLALRDGAALEFSRQPLERLGWNLALPVVCLLCVGLAG